LLVKRNVSLRKFLLSGVLGVWLIASISLLYEGPTWRVGMMALSGLIAMVVVLGLLRVLAPQAFASDPEAVIYTPTPRSDRGGQNLAGASAGVALPLVITLGIGIAFGAELEVLLVGVALALSGAIALIVTARRAIRATDR
jgi:hypothetical protein